MAQVKPSTEIVAKGLQHPWAVAFLNEGRFLVTERSGRLRIIESNGRLQDPIRGLPDLSVTKKRPSFKKATAQGCSKPFATISVLGLT